MVGDMNILFKNRLLKLSTTHLCDANQNIRILPSSIKEMFFASRFVGNAFTVKCDGDLLPVIKALEMIGNNSVLFIDAGNSDDAVLGEIFTTAAKNRGVQAIIINGFCRDVADIKQLGISLYAKGVSPKAGTKSKLGLIQTNLNFFGTAIQPNDLIFGDENGILLFTEQEAETLITQAEMIKQKEEVALKKIREGQNINEILNFSEHYKNVASGILDSQLAWRN
jgi:4-hydroxy-4-methyl-2-oxoglutarate aldolase